MMILVNGATKTVERYSALGCLVQPRKCNSIERVASSGRLWAADNDCYQGLDVERFRSMIRRIHCADCSRLLWVACPDVVSDAQATINRWPEWFPQFACLELPAAFVAQDGLELIADQVPWNDLSCLFIGGSTEWKLSEHAERFAREAKARGKWVHVGRVNTRRRMRDVLMMCSADSIDGGSFSRWPDIKIPKGLRWIREAQSQPSLF